MSVVCGAPKCQAIRGKDAHAWTTCHSCEVGGNYCPKCVHRHFETHQKRPVRCWLVVQEQSS